MNKYLLINGAGTTKLVVEADGVKYDPFSIDLCVGAEGIGSFNSNEWSAIRLDNVQEYADLINALEAEREIHTNLNNILDLGDLSFKFIRHNGTNLVVVREDYWDNWERNNKLNELKDEYDSLQQEHITLTDSYNKTQKALVYAINKLMENGISLDEEEPPIDALDYDVHLDEEETPELTKEQDKEDLGELTPIEEDALEFEEPVENSDEADEVDIDETAKTLDSFSEFEIEQICRLYDTCIECPLLDDSGDDPECKFEGSVVKPQFAKDTLDSGHKPDESLPSIDDPIEPDPVEQDADEPLPFGLKYLKNCSREEINAICAGSVCAICKYAFDDEKGTSQCMFSYPEEYGRVIVDTEECEGK